MQSAPDTLFKTLADPTRQPSDFVGHSQIGVSSPSALVGVETADGNAARRLPPMPKPTRTGGGERQIERPIAFPFCSCNPSRANRVGS
jgi:hypothetical protein